MAPQKETIMVLKVDLDCYRCYTKVKRLLCCYPQIQDQIYNEKQNTVTIKVVCCTPEKIRDKLAAKAGKSIKGIQIVDLKKPADKPADKPASKPKDEAGPPKQLLPPPADKPPKQAAPADKPKDAAPADKPKDAAPADKPKDKPAAPANDKPPMKKNGGDKPPQGDAPPAAAKPKDAGAAPPPKPAEQSASMVRMMPPELIQCYPGYPLNAGCMECFDGRMCYHGNGYGYGAPPPPPPPAGGWGYYGGGGGPSGYGYGGGYKPTYSSNRYGDYISDENPTGCVVIFLGIPSHGPTHPNSHELTSVHVKGIGVMKCNNNYDGLTAGFNIYQLVRIFINRQSL
ncbi:hypothetical protein V2J09_018023 [Rumex salicifolius]